MRMDRFFQTFRGMISRQDPMLASSMTTFLEHIECHRAYIPSETETIETLLSNQDLTVVAMFFVARVDVNGRIRRLSKSVGVDGQLEAVEFTMLQAYLQGCREEVSKNADQDPDAFLMPCPTQAMVLMTVRDGESEPEFYLLMHTALEPLAGIELLHASMRHIRRNRPDDPMISGTFAVH